MPLLTTIRSWFGSPSASKTPPPAYADSTAQAFLAGFQYALSEGGKKFVETIYAEAVEEVLRQMEPTITQRAKDAGLVDPRPILDLQAKQRDFAAKYAATKDEKYAHYLEAIAWMIPTNGH